MTPSLMIKLAFLAAVVLIVLFIQYQSKKRKNQ